MKVIGITGGIACGKSFVTRLFGQWGAQTASADEDARVVVAPGSEAGEAIITIFPEARSADGTLDRAALARRIFADPDARQRLEAITHPAIFARMQAMTDAARISEEAPLLLYEVPLLFEKGREVLFDATVAVVCQPEIQAERLQQREALAGRPPLTQAQIDARLAAQLSGEEKARRADYVIRTDGTIAETEAQARMLWQLLTGSVPAPIAV